MVRFAIYVLLWLLPIAPLQAGSLPLNSLAERIQSGVPVDDELLAQLQASPDGLFALAWLYENGVYGFALDGETAYQYYQKAAEQGQMDAAHYCWWRCLHFTPELVLSLRQAAAAQNPQALYLYSKWLTGQGGSNLSLADKQLVAAAKLKQPEAISELYLQHFLQWTSVKRSFEDADHKLQRCSNEGVVVCYLLLGALNQRHGNAEEALYYYLILQQLDYGMFRQYLSATRLSTLLQRMPFNSLPVVHSRVATRLSNHPATGFDVLDRFSACSSNATYDCIRSIVKRDQVCMLGYFVQGAFSGLRQSDAYRGCMGFESSN
ncbi:MAG: SEL1-like repeat protein [Motiliproteus sp.]